MRLTPATRGLWILMTIILAYGYLIFILYVVITIGTIYLIISHRRQLHHVHNHPMVSRVPYLNVIKNLRKEKFSQI